MKGVFIPFLTVWLVSVAGVRQSHHGHSPLSHYSPLSLLTSSHTVPEVTSNYAYPAVASPYPAPAVASSYGSPDIGSSYGSPDIGSSYGAPAKGSSYGSHGVSSHYAEKYVEEEKLSIDELYDLALEEGGRLIVYAGGDAPGQQNAAKTAFEARFPGMIVEMIVDLSKIHNGRTDNQNARGTLVPDVVQLQTLQDFGRWKKEGHLMPYKPIGWGQVYPQFKDPDGYSTGVHIWAFSNNINKELMGVDEEFWPTEFNDYLVPELKGKIVSTYPNDDDAVLYLYKLIIDKYGWGWMDKFMANQPLFVRSTQTPSDFIKNGTFPVTFSTAGALKPLVTHPAQFVLPKKDPFVVWAQRAAILKGAKRPAAAKLYMSWWLEIKSQTDWFQWSVRKDVPVAPGYRSVFDYPGQTDPIGFDKFMEDRTAVELFKTQVQLYVGEVQGPIPTGSLGLNPTVMLVSAFA